MAPKTENKLFRKLLLDLQQAKENIETLTRQINGIPNETLASDTKDSFKKYLLPSHKRLLESQKLLKIAADHGISIAADFLDETSATALDEKEQKRLETCLKRKAESPAKPFTPRKFKKVDQSQDICKSCGGIGHWWSSPACPNFNKKGQ